MVDSNSQIIAVLRHYPSDCAPGAWTKAASGFSGAEVYRLETPRGPLALRRWPAEHPSPERLTWIHSVLTHAVANGFDRLPLPIRAVDGVSFVSSGGRLWELAPWLPGEAGFRARSSPAKLTAAMQTLAELHRVMASFQPNPRPVGTSPGLASRLEQLRGLLAGGATAIGMYSAAHLTSPKRSEGVPASPRDDRASRVATNDPEHQAPRTLAALWASVTPPDELVGEGAGLSSNALHDAANEILSHFARRAPELERRLTAAAKIRVPLQPALRDIHGEHVLFVGDQVTGIIDYGAMRFETVAGDIARLLGSLAPNDQSSWQAGFAAYETVRPLSTTERELVGVFDSSGVLLGAMNWLNWLFVEQRKFANLARVQMRITELLTRLRASA
ncbi:MAG: phosphotransferase [Pirellulales bacterium]|nr:phosphotransferase [Pirellulales bacterium]